MSEQSLRVLFLAAEADPFVKIGGLGDVAGSLPAALRNLGAPKFEDGTPSAGPGPQVDVRLVIPFHGAIQRQSYPWRKVANLQLSHRDGAVRGEALELDLNGLPVYAIAGELIPADAPVYTPDASADGPKFTFFSLAALELARTLNWVPHIVHANDWHTAPAIYTLFLDREKQSFYYNTATLLGLHNLPYLGVGAGPALQAFGLPPAEDSDLPEWAQNMPLPLALLGADHIVAASPTYAREILTPEFGSGLHEFLSGRKEAISGILNGLDTRRWDPRIDPALTVNYGPESLEARRANKAALQREFGLPEEPDTPLLVMITRLDNQKGVDLAPAALRMLPKRPWQAILLGSGDPALEAAVHELELDYPDRIRVALRFDAALSRRMYAGGDAILIPSRYEPCGLAQMIAMRYGCVPVARAVGGLRDTIQDYRPSGPATGQANGDATGFLFEEATPAALCAAVARALQVFDDRQAWAGLQHNGMAQDFSWDASARQYYELYRSLAEARQAQNESRAS